MDQTALVGPDISGGEQLLRVLDQAHFPVASALWLLRAETQDWRLLLATPLVDNPGPRKAYDRLFRVIDERPTAVPV